MRHCYSLTSQSDWASSISGEQPSLLPHGSFHQGLFYLDWPDPWPLSTDSPIRLQESITGALWGLKQNFTRQSFLSLWVCVFVFALIRWPLHVCVELFERKFSLGTSSRVYWHGTWMATDLAWNMYHEWNANSSRKHLKIKCRICQSCSRANAPNSKTQERKDRPSCSEVFNFMSLQRVPCLLSFAWKKRNECSGFPVKTNMKGITKSSLGPFSCAVCNAASLPPR